MAVLTATHNRRLQGQAYLLRLLEANRPHPVPNHPIAGSDGVFPLPVAPQTINIEQVNRLAIMESRTWRVHDEQGQAPPEFDLSGRMPVTPVTINNKRLDGYELQRALESYIRYYFEQNLQRGRQRRPLLEMQFHDFYSGESWVVVPQRTPLGQRNSNAPLVEQYSFKLIGIRPVAQARPLSSPPKIGLYNDADSSIREACATCFGEES